MEETFEFELPLGAKVRRAETEEEHAILGTSIDRPSPGGIFGGADIWSAMSADGWLYVVYCGDRPGRGFGTHAFRVWPANGHTEWVELARPTELRSTTTIEPNGAWNTFTDARGQRLIRQQVLGYRTPGFPSNGQSAAAPAPVPQPTVDQGAREYTTSVRNELLGLVRQLETRCAQLEARVKQLEARPVGTGGGLTQQSVLDIMWGSRIIVDKVYAELTTPNSGLRSEVIKAAKAGK